MTEQQREEMLKELKGLVELHHLNIVQYVELILGKYISYMLTISFLTCVHIWLDLLKSEHIVPLSTMTSLQYVCVLLMRIRVFRDSAIPKKA